MAILLLIKPRSFYDILQFQKFIAGNIKTLCFFNSIR